MLQNTSTNQDLTTHQHLEVRNEPYRVQWKPILAGATFALAIWLVITLLGVAISLSSVDVDSSRSVKHAMWNAGIFGLMAPTIGCYLGALVAGRGVRFAPHTSRAITGMIVWAVAALAAFLVVGHVVAMFADMTTVNPPATDGDAMQTTQMAATATGKALLATVGASLLALIASVAGGILGGRRHDEVIVAEPIVR